MYAQTDLELTGTVRRPVQCEGLDRGPRRMAEMAASGGVNPQFDWGGLLGNVAHALPGVLGAFGI
jgi:hypothetical protein